MKITVDSRDVEICPSRGTELIRKRLLYVCDHDDHDLHLVPDHHWSLEDVEQVLLAVIAAPSGNDRE